MKKLVIFLVIFLPLFAFAQPSPEGGAKESTLSSLNSKVTACNTGAVAGTVTCNAGTNLNTSALATQSTLSTLNDKFEEGQKGTFTEPRSCSSYSFGTISSGGSAGHTQIVSLTSLKKIRVCYLFLSTDTGTAQSYALTTGTGTNCGTGNYNTTGTFYIPASDYRPLGTPDATLFETSASQALCLYRSGTSFVHYIIKYDWVD